MQVTTNAAAVFNEVRSKNKIKNDAELARRLEVAQSAISAMRSQSIPFGNAMFKRILDRNLMSERRMRALLKS